MSFDYRMRGYEESARGDSSTDSELKVIEDACREASGMVEPCEVRVSAGD